jgi:hypothetical protein
VRSSCAANLTLVKHLPYIVATGPLDQPKEFYVAGGEISPLANGMATAADRMDVLTSMVGIISFDVMMVPFIWDGPVDMFSQHYCSSTYSKNFANLCARFYWRKIPLTPLHKRYCVHWFSFTYVQDRCVGRLVVFSKF